MHTAFFKDPERLALRMTRTATAMTASDNLACG
jgi:hypothetical protein